MRQIKLVKYRLHRYFLSSSPVLPFIICICFLGTMYSIKPMNVCSGYVMSGVFLFVLMTFVSLFQGNKEEQEEEQLLFFHGNGWKNYFFVKEATVVVIAIVYGILLTLWPVMTNWINGADYFSRPLGIYDVIMGGSILFGSGLAGIAIGEIFPPRLMGNRKLAIAIAVCIMLLAIAKEPILEAFPFLKLVAFIIPNIMKPAQDLGAGDYFEGKAVIVFLAGMIIYYLVVVFLKNIALKHRKFS